MEKTIFRGKDESTNTWVFGDLVHIQDGRVVIVVFNEKWAEVLPTTIGQFIGLVDRNKCQIFEGDILRCYRSDKNHSDTNYEISAVMYEEPKVRFALTDGVSWKEISSFDDFEVIGNIYNNSSEVLAGKSLQQIFGGIKNEISRFRYFY